MTTGVSLCRAAAKASSHPEVTFHLFPGGAAGSPVHGHSTIRGNAPGLTDQLAKLAAEFAFNVRSAPVMTRCQKVHVRSRCCLPALPMSRRGGVSSGLKKSRIRSRLVVRWSCSMRSPVVAVLPSGAMLSVVNAVAEMTAPLGQVVAVTGAPSGQRRVDENAVLPKVLSGAHRYELPEYFRSPVPGRSCGHFVRLNACNAARASGRR